MTTDEITALAKTTADDEWDSLSFESRADLAKSLASFGNRIAEVAANEEREACARIANDDADDYFGFVQAATAARDIANAILKRGQS